MIPDGYPRLPEPLPADVIDAHTHLDISYGEAQAPAVAQALALAEAVGVTALVQVGCDVTSSQNAVRMAQEFPGIYAAVALHPNEAPGIYTKGGAAALNAACDEIAALATSGHVVAIGETGMDFFRTEAAGRVAQEESFRRHIEIAKSTAKALMIHDRDAHAEVLRIVDDAGAPPVVVLHCFSGDVSFAQAANERDYYCSFAGNVTFKTASHLREALAVVNPDRLLVETDAPFLTAVPNRGKPNSPYLIANTVRAIAEIRQWDLADTCTLLRNNAVRAFGLA